MNTQLMGIWEEAPSKARYGSLYENDAFSADWRNIKTVINCRDGYSLVTISEISMPEKDWKLIVRNDPLLIAVFLDENDYYTIDFPEAHIYVAEQTWIEAIALFYEDFVYAWETFVEEDENNLSLGAFRIREWLLQNVSKVG